MINRMSLAAVVVTAILMAGACARADDAPKNLKVLPKDMSRQEVISVMKNWTQALGVRCDYCHVQTVPGDFESFDWASDEKEHKITARRMVQMAMDLNGKALPDAAGEKDAQVACVTCHRGLTNPATIDKVMLEVVDKDGATAAVAKYRELRGSYYGSGSYDFRPSALAPVIETLVGRDKGLDGALLFGELNVELNPDDADSRVMLGTLLLQKGDKKGAAAAANKAQELQPDNRQAARLLKQLGQ
jgi:hypothetical protein